MKNISILGCTGSIGRQTLAVVEALAGQFWCGAGCGVEHRRTCWQIERHRPEVVVGGYGGDCGPACRAVAREGDCSFAGDSSWAEGMLAVGTHGAAEIVVSAAVGVGGTGSYLRGDQAGKGDCASNKEVLVAAGELVMAAVEKSGKELLPVDSEHNAVHQCLRGGTHGEVLRIVLTASGGPFRKTPLKNLANVTTEQALAHPNWRMGNRITIDSATMMNKGFEVIEARWLFGMKPDQIEVVIHPQSTIHSMVEYVDGSVLAQLGPTDMRMPIRYALTYPARVATTEVNPGWGNFGGCILRRLRRGGFRVCGWRPRQ